MGVDATVATASDDRRSSWEFLRGPGQSMPVGHNGQTTRVTAVKPAQRMGLLDAHKVPSSKRYPPLPMQQTATCTIFLQKRPTEIARWRISMVGNRNPEQMHLSLALPVTCDDQPLRLRQQHAG